MFLQLFLGKRMFLQTCQQNGQRILECVAKEMHLNLEEFGEKSENHEYFKVRILHVPYVQGFTKRGHDQQIWSKI